MATPIFALRFRNPRSKLGGWASVTRSAKAAGWQLTWHDDLGPVGDTIRDGPDELVEMALREGYEFAEARGPAIDLGLELVHMVSRQLEAVRADVDAFLREV